MEPVGLVDTSVIISFLRGYKPVADRFKALVRTGCAKISAVSVFEVKLGENTANDSRISDLLALIPVLPFDAAAADHAASIERTLRARGQVIGTRDTFIAGIALAHELPIYTQDTEDFSRIEELTVINPEGIG